KGALPKEFPENAGPQPNASAQNPKAYANVSIFAPIKRIKGHWHGILKNKADAEIRYPTAPFMGIMGVAPDSTEKIHSVPPSVYGGNLDISDLTAGSTISLPVFVPGGMFYTGDPRMAQGEGEVA